jgi:hypothetical protein
MGLEPTGMLHLTRFPGGIPGFFPVIYNIVWYHEVLNFNVFAFSSYHAVPSNIAVYQPIFYILWSKRGQNILYPPGQLQFSDSGSFGDKSPKELTT